MAWTIKFDERAIKELKKLDVPIQRDIIRYLKERVASGDNPRAFGKSLRSKR